MMTMDSMLCGGGGGILHGGDSTASRGVNALHRRAQQLKRWQEAEKEYTKQEMKRNATRIKFSDATIFLAACATSDFEECERLLSSDVVNINVTNVDGLTGLHQACIDDNIKMVKYLIEKGADINCCDNEGWSPLHAASSCGNINICQLLLDYGADPTVVNNDGELASDIADNDLIEELILKKLYEIVTEKNDIDLLRKQEQVKMMQDVDTWIKSGSFDDKPHPRSGATILHVAAAKGYINVIEALLHNKKMKQFINVNARDNDGWTPLHAACHWKQPGAVELLILNGADVEVKSTSGQSLEEVTDHELILKLIENRRNRLKEEQKLREQLANGSEQKVVPPSPPSLAPTPTTESETQRKAHAKRVRETRRSTQGISADDVNKAKDQINQLKQAAPTTMPSTQQDIPSSISTADLTDSTSRAPIKDTVTPEKDFKSLHEKLMMEHEKQTKDHTQREQEWNREKRQLQRKIGELEEDVKQLEQLKVDNQRLKDENGALIRVISKLSK